MGVRKRRVLTITRVLAAPPPPAPPPPCGVASLVLLLSLVELSRNVPNTLNPEPQIQNPEPYIPIPKT